MRFTTLSTITALAAATLTSAAPLEARQDTLLPFEVTQVLSERRSPALGPEWKTITVNFTDPNPYPFFQGEYDLSVPGGLQGVNCVIKWFRDESPEGRTWPCDRVGQGYFGLQFLPGTTGAVDQQDFKLRFIHEVQFGSGYSIDPVKVVAEVAFQLPNTRDSCLKSGWCHWRPEKLPLQAPVTKTVR